MDLKHYLGQNVVIKIDRALGSRHPEHGFVYGLNYGYLSDTEAPDGEEIDAYLIGTAEPVQKASGKCIAIIHRTNDDDDKLVIALPDFENIADEVIEKLTDFQEKYFKHIIVR